MIHVLSDSHGNAFTGRPEMIGFYPETYTNKWFKCYRLGPQTAYNISKRKDLILEAVNSGEFNKNADKVLFCLGEIDIRLHIPSKMIEHDISIFQACQNTVDKIIDACLGLREHYVETITNSVHGTTWYKDEFVQEFPRVGDERYRNHITEIYNALLKYSSNIHKIQHLDTSHYFIDSSLYTKREFYMDPIHLDPVKCLPIFVKELGLE